MGLANPQIARPIDLPNIQTSLSPVNLLKLILSGAIHLMGSFPWDAGEGIM